MFARPGRWIANVLERLSDDPDVPEDSRALRAQIAREWDFADCHVPADVETVAFLAPGPDGDRVVHEALSPGTVMLMTTG